LKESRNVTTAGELATKLGGTLRGDPNRQVAAIRPPESAGPTDLAYLADDRPVPREMSARVILIGEKRTVDGLPEDATLLLHPHPHLAFAEAISLLMPIATSPFVGISDAASIDSSSSVGDNVNIAPGVVIGPRVQIGDRVRLDPGVVILSDCVIGDDVELHANVTLYAHCKIGDRSRCLAGAVVGADGFGFVPTDHGSVRVPHVGGVQIGSDVEIGANSTIDRGVLEDTQIYDGTKLDNLCHIAHNCEIGPAAVFAAQVGIAGSSRVGSGVVMGGQSGAAGHLEIGDACRVGARAGVIQSVPRGVEVHGFPAIPAPQARRSFVLMQHLPEFRRQIQVLSSRVEELAKRLAE